MAELVGKHALDGVDFDWEAQMDAGTDKVRPRPACCPRPPAAIGPSLIVHVCVLNTHPVSGR